MASTVLQWLGPSGYATSAVAKLFDFKAKALAANAAASYSVTEDAASPAPAGMSWYSITVAEDVAGDIEAAHEVSSVTVAGGTFFGVTDTADTFYPFGATAAATTAANTVLSGTTLTLVRADDYLTGESRQIVWTNTELDAHSDLTGATVRFRVSRGPTKADGLITDLVVTVTVATGLQSYWVQIADTDTQGLELGTYRYQVVATLASGAIETLTEGDLVITHKIDAV